MRLKLRKIKLLNITKNIRNKKAKVEIQNSKKI